MNVTNVQCRVRQSILGSTPLSPVSLSTTGASPLRRYGTSCSNSAMTQIFLITSPSFFCPIWFWFSSLDVLSSTSHILTSSSLRQRKTKSEVLPHPSSRCFRTASQVTAPLAYETCCETGYPLRPLQSIYERDRV